MVTDRMPSIEVQGRTTHQVGLPYHWGTRGLTTGDSANDLAHMALDPNVHIQEKGVRRATSGRARRPRRRAAEVRRAERAGRHAQIGRA